MRRGAYLRCSTVGALQREPFYAVVRQMTGQSFIAFLKEYRLNAAAEALHTTDDTVLSIASRCGFENLSYFNRAFKAHFGLTPREHRKK